MWFPNDSITLYLFLIISGFADEKSDSPVLGLLASKTSSWDFSELIRRGAPSSRSLAQAPMNQAISDMNIT